ncbi:MAG: hypothetical protein Q8N23_05935 [Archangium sp.]|nr:hypothetical protein [Archangium sp.]MDP3152190.1 hypothetical protein [Archangium sp.]MDP3574929.1 hypothetical protein [Archangium sp.]
MQRSIIVVSVLAFGACTHPQVSESAPLSGPGKPAAPVEISAEVTPTHARLALRFESDGEATVTVSGIDGLTVTLAPEAAPRKFARGESAQLDVDYTGESGTLVVNVSGSFGGATKSRVVTFAVGDVKPVSGGTKVTPDNGPAFKALPSGK